jgi:hypothetical protein
MPATRSGSGAPARPRHPHDRHAVGDDEVTPQTGPPQRAAAAHHTENMPRPAGALPRPTRVVPSAFQEATIPRFAVAIAAPPPPCHPRQGGSGREYPRAE